MSRKSSSVDLKYCLYNQTKQGRLTVKLNHPVHVYPKVRVLSQTGFFLLTILPLLDKLILSSSNLYPCIRSLFKCIPFQVYSNTVQFSPPGIIVYSFIRHLHMRLLQALICEPSKAGATKCLTAGEPSDLGRVKDSA